MEASEQAYHFGKGKLAIRSLDGSQISTAAPRLFSNRLHCAQCDIEYREPSPALFSFNHPVGACPACRGFGRIITIDYDLALPDRSKTLADGVVKPWQSGQSAECQDDLMKFCRKPQSSHQRSFPGTLEKMAGLGHQRRSRITARTRLTDGRARGTASRAISAGSNPSPTKCTCACCFRAIAPTRPVPIAKGSGSSPKPCFIAPASAKIGRNQNLTLADFYLLPVRDALRFIERLPASRKCTSPPTRSASR